MLVSRFQLPLRCTCTRIPSTLSLVSKRSVVRVVERLNKQETFKRRLPSSQRPANSRLRRLQPPRVAAPPKPSLHKKLATAPKISESTVMSMLKSQPAHYVVAQLHNRSHLLTPSDILTLPRIKDVAVGDVIRLTRVLEVGSRDYTLRSTPRRLRNEERRSLSEREVEVRALVLEHTRGPMIVRTKHRMGGKHMKTVKNRNLYTRLRIGPIRLGTE